jgi:protein-L-isoaspartate(D-aspartate) O-methyltransferase
MRKLISDDLQRNDRVASLLLEAESMGDLDDIRRKYAEGIRDVLKLRFNIVLSKDLVDAFAKVPRESFLGPGPWLIRGTGNNIWQKFTCWLHRSDPTGDWITVDPEHLYRHDAIVAIVASRGLNNGQPSGLASWIHFLELHKGDHVLHIGCGVGYYTAIIAEVVGPTGHVIAIEIDPELASRACENLACLDHVDVVHGDGGEYVTGPTDAVLVNAGATHPRSAWLDSLQVGGRMIMPLTTEKGRGGVLKAKRELRGYAARFVFTTQIFDCVGGRDAELSKRLHDGFKRGAWRLVQSLRREPHDPSKSCWLHGDGFCLSTLPVSDT